MKILVCGDRNWVDKKAIFRELSKYPRDTIVIEGEARGADSLARVVALGLGVSVERYPANWDKYGRAAGPIRNQQMLDQKPDLVLAFHADLDNSKGTRDMVIRARKAGIEVLVFQA